MARAIDKIYKKMIKARSLRPLKESCTEKAIHQHRKARGQESRAEDQRIRKQKTEIQAVAKKGGIKKRSSEHFPLPCGMDSQGGIGIQPQGNIGTKGGIAKKDLAGEKQIDRGQKEKQGAFSSDDGMKGAGKSIRPESPLKGRCRNVKKGRIHRDSEKKGRQIPKQLLCQKTAKKL